MKKYIMPLFVLSATLLSAQFKIDGTIRHYPQKPVLIKIYDNGDQRVVKRVETGADGSFSYQHPTAYTGKVLFELAQGGYDAVTVNSDIEFTTDLQDPTRRMTFTDAANRQVADAFQHEDRKALKDYTLVELLKLYQPQDEFYQALEKEITRIESMSSAEIKDDALAYYVQAKHDMARYNSNQLPAAQVLDAAKQHLIMDNMHLENFGLLQDFLSIYISYAITGATSKDQAGQKIETAMDALLVEAQTDTSRGQAILTGIIPMLEGNGFDTLSAKYLSQAESLTCEITPELKDLIAGKNNIKVGAKVPDIQFGKTIKGAKSLYDIKADQKLLVFWASWCPHCMNEIPHLKSFYTDFAAKGGEIVAVSLDIEKAPYERVTADTPWINYSDLMKWESPLVRSFGITSTPTMILVDKDNKVIKTGTRISEFM